MDKADTLTIIKDCIFESVLMGNDVVHTLRSLHFIDGFEKQDIIDAYHEMKKEAEAAS